MRRACLLAGGPRGVGGRPRLRCRCSAAEPPRRASAVIVEGLADKRAVQRAVPDPVFVLGSSTWVDGRNGERVLAELARGLPRVQRAVVLLDPDVAGRQGRDKLEAAFPGRLWHAFIPARDATAAQATRWHTAGNVGVEHASPDAIRRALAGARRASADRREFTKEALLAANLTSSHTTVAGGNAKWRRQLVCACLGLGACDGRQLLRQLNAYGFSRADLDAALQEAEAVIAAAAASDSDAPAS